MKQSAGLSFTPTPFRKGFSSTFFLIPILSFFIALQTPSVTAAQGSLTNAEGKISGILRSPKGEPLAGARVIAISADIGGFLGGQSIEALTRTNAEGRFQLENIPPGRYFIAAGALEAPVYFPGVVNPSLAAQVRVTAGAVFTGMDFMLIRTLFNIKGSILSEYGGTGAARVTFGSAKRQTTVQVRPNGTFEIRDLVPGSYSITFMRPAANGQLNRIDGLPSAIEIVDRDLFLELKTPRPPADNPFARSLDALIGAANSIRMATSGNKGGHREIALAEVEEALSVMSTAEQKLNQTSIPKFSSAPPILPDFSVPVGQAGRHVNFDAALTALREAYVELTRAPGVDPEERQTIVERIDASARAIRAGIAAAADGSTVAPTRAPLLTRDDAPPLVKARDALLRAFDSLQRASSNNKGGNREKAIDAVEMAIQDVENAMEFLDARPARVGDPPGPPAVERPVFDPPSGLAGKNGNMDAALDALRTAFDELTLAGGGDLGGNRNNANLHIAVTARFVIEGILAAK